MYENLGNFIDGQWSNNTKEKVEVFNPFNEEVIGTIPSSKEKELDEALRSAKNAMENWKKTSPWERSKIIKKTADLINDGKIEGISTIRDESDRKGMRIVYVLKRDAIPNIVLNKLYKFTPLQSSFSVNNVALVNGRPQLLNLKDLIHHFVDHRHDVVVRRTKFELKKAEDRCHILEGLIIASDNIDEVIALIKASKNAEDARDNLIKKFKLSEIQAKAIVEMRLRQLTGLEQDKLRSEYEEIKKLIEDLKDILSNEDRRMNIISEELNEIKEKYGDERRSVIEYSGGDLSIEDMIPDEKVVITISHAGYIKRTSLDEYKVQNRGGVGQKASTTRNEDFLEDLFVGTNHQYMLFFTQKGKCFWMRVYEIPEGSKPTGQKRKKGPKGKRSNGKRTKRTRTRKKLSNRIRTKRKRTKMPEKAKRR